MRDAIFKTRSREGGGVTVTAANRARKGAVGGRRVLADGRRASYESLSLLTYSLLTGTPSLSSILCPSSLSFRLRFAERSRPAKHPRA